MSVTPINTYVSWEGHYKPEDCKLICTYHIRDDKEAKMFEKSALLGNRLFHDVKLLGDDSTSAYIFDLSSHKDNWECFINGTYSEISPEHKKRIKDFYGEKNPNFAYIESYLEPNKYFNMYARMMEVDEKILQETGQLCDKPDLKQETLEANVKNLQIREELT